MKKLIFSTVAAVVFFSYGAAVERYSVFPHDLLDYLEHRLQSIFPQDHRWVVAGRKLFHDRTGRRVIACSQLSHDNTMVLLALGQSNSANHGNSLYQPHHRVFNFFQGDCFAAKDPLLGATGHGGSVWTRFADIVIERGHYDKVLLVPLGITATSVSEWTPGGEIFSRIDKTHSLLKTHGISVTHVVWHQGETDTLMNTTTHAYSSALTNVISGIRDLGISAPVFVSIASYVRGADSEAVRTAQRHIINEMNGVFPGPDTDNIVDKDPVRHDGVHFSGKGLTAFASHLYRSLFSPASTHVPN